MQFIYVLKLIPRLLNEDAWTEKDNTIIEKHFTELQNLQATGRLILAGRTTQEDEADFGLVIVKGSQAEAYQMMVNDPAVKEGIMTASLYPYKVALISEENI